MVDSNRIGVIAFEDKYATAAVKMWRESKQKALGIPELHSFDDHLLFLQETLVKTNSVYLAIERDRKLLVGLLATDGEFINQLYVHVDFQRKGVGSKLLHIAKEKSDGHVRLYTFERNHGARRFYEKHGFELLSRGKNNEEGLPDLLYEWRRDKHEAA